MIKPINPTSMHAPIRPYYNNGILISSGPLLFISGQVGLDKDGKLIDGGIEAQTVQTFENVKAIVEDAGGTMANIVSVIVYLVDMNDAPVVSEVRMRYFSDPMPSSTSVGVDALIMPEMIVEVSAIAALPATSATETGS